MQVNDNYPLLGQLHHRLLYPVKLLISALCFWFLYFKWQQRMFNAQEIVWPAGFGWLMISLFLMMILNWYLEAFRWNKSINQFEHISIGQAWKDVLAGLTMNLIFPFTTGDLAARMLLRKDKYRTASAILLNRSLMFLLTLIFGLFGVYHSHLIAIELNLISIAILLLCMILLVGFRRKMHRFLICFKEMNSVLLWKIVGVSVLRYLVFSLQFFLAIYLYNPQIDTMFLLGGIGWIFLSKSIVPSFLGGIGLRESAAVIYFGSVVLDTLTVIMPVFLLWIINTAFPSLIGTILVFKIKINIA